MILRGMVLKQPWADACIFLGKDVENRTRPLKHRGPLVIVAGANRSDAYYWDARVWMAAHAGIELGRVRFDGLQHGGIIGCVEMYDVVTPEQYPATQWHMQGQYGYRIRNAVALPFRPLKGHQGLMNIEMTDAEIEAIEAGGIKCASCHWCKTPSFTSSWQPREGDGWICCPHCQGI